MYLASNDKPRLQVGRRSRCRGSARAIILAVILVIGGVAAYVLRSNARLRPAKFVIATSRPVKAMAQNETWYWLDLPDGPKARIMKAAGNTLTQFAAADAISSYEVTPKAVTWTSREGKTWSVKTAGPDGNPRVLWTGADRAMGLKVDGDMVFFLVLAPSPAGTNIPIPALDARLNVMAASLTGGSPNKIATLYETDGAICGVHDKSLFITAYRGSAPGNTAIYTLPAQGAPKRIAGEIGRSAGFVARDGSVYWTGQSKESSQEAVICSIMRMKPGGKVEVLSDWYPENGRFVETARGVLYVDGGIRQTIWPIAERHQMPEPLPNSPSYNALGITDSEILYSTVFYTNNAVQIFRGPVP